MGSESIVEEHRVDDAGNPAGGETYGRGFEVYWQEGLVVDGEPNGAFVDNVIAAARGRLAHYQTTKFACDANAEAIRHLDAAATALDRRRTDRLDRDVENTHDE